MCLVVVAWQQHPHYPLVVAGNRDEFHERPTAALDFWDDQPDIAGGRDLKARGTWLAVNRNGRFATVTNFRDAAIADNRLRSRGHLVTEFLRSTESAGDYLSGIDGDAYAGFNLLVADGNSFGWYSNRGGEAIILPPGIYGLSNALLDSPWHKVTSRKAAMAGLISREQVTTLDLFDLLSDQSRAPEAEVEVGRLPFETAHAITAPFIVQPDYGTRCSSAVLADKNGHWQISERRFAPDGTTTGESRIEFDNAI